MGLLRESMYRIISGNDVYSEFLDEKWMIVASTMLRFCFDQGSESFNRYSRQR